MSALLYRVAMGVLSFAVAASCASCRSEPNLNGDDPSSGNSPLPPQESKGLRAEADFRAVEARRPHTHILDLRLVNASSSAKKNVSVETVELAGYHASFRRPPASTLWNRGSSISFPGIATWDVSKAPGTFSPLTVRVRFEDAGGAAVATFRWDVRVGPPR